jgi:NAD(P)-dependent dehydrogenase (short-subunit alcohol dehydrogenase family)
VGNDAFSLAGAEAVVVGAGRGIGRDIALALAGAGARVAVAARTLANAQAVADRASALTPGARGYAVDAVDPEGMGRFAAAVLADFPVLSIVVNCVGDSARRGPLVALPAAPEVPGLAPDEWDGIVALNLSSIYLGARAFGPHLLAQGGGAMVNVTGVRAFRAGPNMAAYAAAKAAGASLTASLALEWAPHGVRVNAVAPGLFPDPEHEPAAEVAAYEDRVRHRIPLGRVGRGGEVGQAVVFLASAAASYVTGQSLAVDGGNGLV